MYYTFVVVAACVTTNWLQRDNVVSSCCNVISYMKELKTAIQCLGIKPTAIHK